MKKVFWAVIGATLVAASVAALGLAQPSATTTGNGPLAVEGVQASSAALPPLPAEVRQRQRWNIAVKCDSPPFGYIDVQGGHAGFDVEIARWFSRFAFGRSNRVSFTCITTPAREASLQSKRVDLVIATYTWTAARDNIIDFSRAYYKATGRLLVRNESSIRSVADLGGKTVATTRGSIYDRWVGNCFKSANLLVTDSSTNGLAFRDGGPTRPWGRLRARGDRQCRADAQADGRPLPAAPVRDRDPACKHRDEAVGRLAAEHHAQSRRLLPDHEGKRARAAARRLREEHPAPEAAGLLLHEDGLDLDVPLEQCP